MREVEKTRSQAIGGGPAVSPPGSDCDASVAKVRESAAMGAYCPGPVSRVRPGSQGHQWTGRVQLEPQCNRSLAGAVRGVTAPLRCPV